MGKYTGRIRSLYFALDIMDTTYAEEITKLGCIYDRLKNAEGRIVELGFADLIKSALPEIELAKKEIHKKVCEFLVSSMNTKLSTSKMPEFLEAVNGFMGDANE